MGQPPLLQTGIGVVAPYDFALDRELCYLAEADVEVVATAGLGRSSPPTR